MFHCLRHSGTINYRWSINMIRKFQLNSLKFDIADDAFVMRASGRLTLRVNEQDWQGSRLAIDARIGDELQAKIIRMVEDEIAAQLDAEPTSSGEAPNYREECEDIPA
jgi:hypothetical protein